MFSCFSRDDKDELIQTKNRIKNERTTFKSLIKDNKPHTIKKTLKIKESVIEKKKNQQSNSIKIVILKQAESSFKKIDTSQAQGKQIKNEKDTLRIIRKQQRQVTLSEILQQKEEVYQSEIVNSVTSFGIVFEESHSNTKRQIQKIVQQLTSLSPFNPKINENTLQGCHKTNIECDEDEPNVEELSNSSSLKKQSKLKPKIQGTKQYFSQCMLERKYDQAFLVFKQMSCDQKNSFDRQEFSPLHLATLLSIYEQKQALSTLKNILKDPDIKPHRKGHLNEKPIEEAILFKSIPTLTNLFRASYLYKNAEIRKSLKQIVKNLQQLPDLQIQLYVKVGSFVPFVDKFTPDDTIKIYKKGKNLRIDYTLVGYTFLQAKRRPMSCCIHQLNNGQFTIIAVNHDKKCYADLLETLQDQQLVLIIQDLINTEIKRTNPQIVKTSISKDLNIFNQVIREHIATGIAIKHEISVTYNSQTQKLKPDSLDIHKHLAFLNNWESYKFYKTRQIIPKKQKQLKLGVWTCQQFPLNLQQLLEIIKFLSYAHQSGQIIYNFLSHKKLKELLKGFPVKIQIPINYSLFFDIKIAQIKLQSPQVPFQFVKQYSKLKRSEYQKTKIRQEKRLTLIKLYT